MISIALCDNEDVFLDLYQSKLELISQKFNIHLDITRFSSGESLLFYLADNLNKFQIIYLDIMMNGINGVDTALEIRKLNPLVKIIFLTSSTEFVYHAFDANASNYLIKDLHDNKFEDVFMTSVKEIQRQDNQPHFTMTSQKGSVLIPFRDIVYFESYKRLLICHTASKKTFEYYYKISDLAEDLKDKSFILVHRSYLVNFQYILKLTKSEVYLKDGSILPVSRNNYDLVKSKLFEKGSR